MSKNQQILQKIDEMDTAYLLHCRYASLKRVDKSIKILKGIKNVCRIRQT